MFVGSYRIELFFPESRSLKAKRSVLNRLKSRLSQLNLSVAEVDGQLVLSHFENLGERELQLDEGPHTQRM